MSTQSQAALIEKSSWYTHFVTGLALFTMFFGSGNLTFPLLIGKSVGENVWFSIAGLGVTAVIVPFFGLAAMILFQADYHKFFGRIGKIPGVALILLLQLILGPFGAIPRLVVLMHATAKPYLADISLAAFSVIATAVILLCIYRKEKLVGLLGALTPLLLFSMAALVFLGISKGTTINPSFCPPQESFYKGLVGGYHTMDLIAAFVFATVVLPRFQSELKATGGNQRSLFKKIFFSSLVAGALLFVTYIGLAMVSVFHVWTLPANCPPEQLLSTIALKIFGPVGGFIAAVAIVLACLTTAMTLTATFVEYARKDLCKERVSTQVIMALTLVVTVLFSNLGFANITAFLGPILQVVYPGLIVLTGANLLHFVYGYQSVKLPVLLAFIASLAFYFV